MTSRSYERLDLYDVGDEYILTPAGSRLESSSSISFSKTNGTVSKFSGDPGLENRCDGCIYGVFGLFKLVGVSILVLIKSRTLVGTVAGDKIWRMSSYSTYELKSPQGEVTNKSNDEINRRYIKMITKVLNNCKFIYSYDRDITKSLQRLSSLEKDPSQPYHYVDFLFCWNLVHTEDIRNMIESSNKEISDSAKPFLLNIACGYARTFKSLIGKKSVEMTLISRVGKGKPGIRYHSRGADINGDVANFVESEQIICTSNKDIMSFVQIRGSIPILWEQPVDGRYRPKLSIGDSDLNSRALANHYDKIIPYYKKVYSISLIDRSGYEAPVGKEYEAGLDKYSCSNLAYVSFNFHEECKNMKWENTSILINKLKDDMNDQSYFHADPNGNVVSEQHGVYRTNCIDCIDRTNVVQSELAKVVLGKQLKSVGILAEDKSVDMLAELDYLHRTAWVGNADAISMMYSGTNALKTDFTRLKKRTLMGSITDILKSCIRHYRNNYMDGYLQDSLILFTGKFDPKKAPSDFSPPDRTILADMAPMLKVAGVLLIHYTLSKRFMVFSSPLATFATYVLTLYVTLKYALKDIIRKVDLPTMVPNYNIES